ncbi:ATP-binding protein [uncultured Draconibacterium sp.]|uniref:ATP-binding protein n=1 Tax=uncultured Draconibacterium sp. TaxID=1573823 RepID=UPI00325FFF4D
MKQRIVPIINLLIILLLVHPSVSFALAATSNQADSLRQVIEKTTGKKQINAQLDLAMHLFERKNEAAKEQAALALLSAKKIGDSALHMRAYFVMGRVSHVISNIQLSQAYLDSALTLAAQLDDNYYKSEILLRTGINQHTQGEHLLALQSFNTAIQTGRMSENFRTVGASYSMMGTIFRVNGLYDRAIEYIIKSKLSYQKAEYTEGYAWTAYLLGRIYADLHLYDKAMEYFQDALKTYSDLAEIDENPNGLAICYEQIGMLNLEAGATDEARKNIEFTLGIHRESKSKYGISNSYKNLGRIEFASGNYTLAEQYLMQALDSKAEIGDLLSQPSIYSYLGQTKIKQGKAKQGLGLIEKGLEQAILNNQKRVQFDIYSILSQIYLEFNLLEKALSCQQQQINIQDSMLLGAANIKMDQLQGIYEIDAKNSQIAQLQQENEINALKLKQHRASILYMVLGIFLAILIAAIIFVFYRRLRQNNLQLAEANEAKNKFLAIIAHDLRGPTHTQTAFLDHLIQEFDSISPNELKNLLQIIHQSSENTSNLLDNLLLWAQSQVKKMEVKPVALNLADVINKALGNLHQAANLKQINFAIDTKEQLMVYSDPNMLQTVVRNLVSNSIKFTPRGGSIAVKTCEAKQNEVCITITDTGVGMSAEKLSKLFDIGTKSNSPGTENEKSTGLGLVLVKDFVEKNNGTIHIESEKGKGTSVVVTLPAA